MTPYPSIEALKGAHSFPGTYAFRIFGTHEQAFIDSVHAQAVVVLEDRARYTMEVRPSSKGRYCVARIEAQVHTAEEVQALYVAFSDVEGLKTML